MSCTSKDDDQREFSRGRRALVRCLRIAGYLFFVYATTYFIVMDTNSAASNPLAKAPLYDSSYWFAERIGWYRWRTSCWANRVFWPMDCLVQPWLKPCNKAAYGEWQREEDEQWWQEFDKRLREWEGRPRDQKR